MRIRLVIQVLSLTLIVTAATVWMRSRATAVDLQTRLSALTTFRRYTARSLEQERDRLRSALAEANRHRPADANATSSLLAAPTSQRVVASSLTLGEWRSAREWRNEGQSTARGTVATLLWAAAGGDVNAMMRIIAFDEAGRTQAQALFNDLPPASHLAFPTPEALVAGLTIQTMPASAAQLSWFHQRDADHATVGLLLGAPDEPVSPEVVAVPGQGDRPPMLVDHSPTKITVLSLERSPQGWRIVIPAVAIGRLSHAAKPPSS